VSEDFDVIIVGAGLSGIGAACRIGEAHPGRRYAILEARDAIGGTWDLFRYPGVRSDSDMFTLGYPFRPWKAAKAIAMGDAILAYIRETAEAYGVTPHIRFGHRITAARWSSAEAAWTLDVEVDGAARRYRCNFLYVCAGYYRYDTAHMPDFPGMERFQGTIAHPQWWPQQLDYTGKRVVVIGSGATAVTIVPAMAARAAHVTMLQRSPTYIASLPDRDPIADAIRAVLPEGLAHRVIRGKNMLLSMAFFQFCRRFPNAAARYLRKQVASHLPPGYPVERHFTPSYNPWDQRLCLVPEADLFKAISAGTASVVTDTIATFTEHGVVLASGETLDADIVVTATGLTLNPCGGIALVVDGAPIALRDQLVYKGMMLSGVPNLAWCVGYTNASWTLRADLSWQYVCRLLAYLDDHGYDQAVPRAEPGDVDERPLLDFKSGYVVRAADILPRQGSRAPWFLRQNYVLDYVAMKLGELDDSMVFSRAADHAGRVAS
jgi:cation diffusion facilitator CzcD-associated flavoprotein CzcO